MPMIKKNYGRGGGRSNFVVVVVAICIGSSNDSNKICLLVSAVKTLNRQNKEMKNELHILKSTCIFTDRIGHIS